MHFFYALLQKRFWFLIANRYNIIDNPNSRSSRNYITVRGGGIIFPLACLAVLPFSSFINVLSFCVDLTLISAISFIDDIGNLNIILRLAVQSLAVVVAILSLGKNLEWYQLAIIFIVLIGAINAYNFMDGINGITALYSIVTMGSFFLDKCFCKSVGS